MADRFFDGNYALISQKYGEFADHDMCASWMAGVVEGCASVDARMAHSVSSPDTAPLDQVVLNLLIVRDKELQEAG